jgi:glucose/arabinose dehydrogenase
MRVIFASAVLLFVCAATASAQLKSQVVVTGLSQPVAFVQDPSLADTQYVVEQGGRIRVIQNGQLSATDFLNLQSAISSGGERGLLGLAFAPDYPTSGRFFVNFTNPDGDTVVARFRHSDGNPRVADPSSRFDLQWPSGNRYIAQPYANHNGGNLQFGPEGLLYIGLGDGGSGDDPENRAQTPSTLLGKMLRIDVNVSDNDPLGYRVPPGNPFVGAAGYLPEIWAVGLRNPWRYSFDSFGAAATGALIIGDVGQSAIEEIDYEPAARAGRNYGWRYREGAHDHVTSIAPLFLPLTDPIYEYDHTVGQTVVGGYVYRGAALPASYRARYFFADYVAGRVWSMALTIAPSGEAAAADVHEHTAELGGAATLGNISSFGIDATGELYLVGYSKGEIRRVISEAPATHVAMALDLPGAGLAVQPFQIAGWALDTTPGVSGTGIDTVHVWAIPTDASAPAVFLGAAYGAIRTDVAAIYGAQYQTSGYALTASGLNAGTYQISAFAHSSVTSNFELSTTRTVSVATGPAMSIDFPPNGTTAPRFTVAGWAIDLDSTTGSGVDAVHVWAYPAVGPPRFVGIASYGFNRGDVGALFGGRFTNSGWSVTAAGLPPGAWTLVASAHSTVTNTFRRSASVAVQVQSGATLQIDAPSALHVGSSFTIAGWALDLADAAGNGIGVVDVWAFPTSGGAPIFVGETAPAISRADVAAIFGAQFSTSGYQVTATLPPGQYDVAVYAKSTVTGTFDATRVVRVIVP